MITEKSFKLGIVFLTNNNVHFTVNRKHFIGFVKSKQYRNKRVI